MSSAAGASAAILVTPTPIQRRALDLLGLTPTA
jgi:hypothetical protein